VQEFKAWGAAAAAADQGGKQLFRLTLVRVKGIKGIWVDLSVKIIDPGLFSALFCQPFDFMT
jgi:hypothetical protein